MGMTAEGTLYVEMNRVREWINFVFPGEAIEAVRYLRPFEDEDSAIEVHRVSGPHTYVPMELFWDWVHEQALPPGLQYMESVFGVPKFGDHDMELTFAVSSISWPGEWSPPPACLAEWVIT